MSKIEQIELELNHCKLELAKFNNGNNAAGTRARLALMTIIKEAKLLRQEIQDSKKN